MLKYDAVSGKLTKEGEPNWVQSTKLSTTGYLRQAYKGKLWYTHRLAWFLHYGTLPKQVDHINGDRTDNRICNLRLADDYENQQNTGIQRDNTSGVKGVYLHKRTGKWTGQLRAFGKRFSIGYHITIGEAETAMRELRQEKHGMYANHGT